MSPVRYMAVMEVGTVNMFIAGGKTERVTEVSGKWIKLSIGS